MFMTAMIVRTGHPAQTALKRGHETLGLYAYVGDDPINFTDPLGLREICWTQDKTHMEGDTVVVDSFRSCVDIPDWAVDLPGPPLFWDGEAPPPTQSLSPDLTRVCDPVPPAPPGVNIDNIIQYGLSSADMNILNKYAFTYNNFRNGAGMDFKQIRADPLGKSPFEDFGNFAYGAFTNAIGLGSVAHAFAGIAQIFSGNAQFIDFMSNFDDPADQEQISAGARYAACKFGD